MEVIPLQSGSKGNCYFVESADTRLLVDAGISPRQTVLRLAAHDRDIERIDGLIITHDHSDHCRYAGDLCHRFGLPVHLTARTLAALKPQTRELIEPASNCFEAGESFSLGDFLVHSIPTPHDAADSVAYVLESTGQRLGILTDLGHAFGGLRDVLASLDAVVIESNYDDQMLDSSPYPDFLKRRIKGKGGHLSNEEAARLLHHHASQRLQWVCLCHLSGENNCPDLARETHQRWLGPTVPLFVADRSQASSPMKLA